MEVISQHTMVKHYKTNIMKLILTFIWVTIFYYLGMCQDNSHINKYAKQFINNCVDSINHLKNGDSIPIFLNNPCLDYKKEYWNDMHHPVPLRKLIVDKIKNIESIKYILQKSNERLYLTCNRPTKDNIGLTYYTIQYADKSFGDLLKTRLAELSK